MQLTYVIDERLIEAAKDTKQEKALKDVAATMEKEKGKVAEVAQNKARSAEKFRLEAENKLTEMEVKLWGTKLNAPKRPAKDVAQLPPTDPPV